MHAGWKPQAVENVMQQSRKRKVGKATTQLPVAYDKMHDIFRCHKNYDRFRCHNNDHQQQSQFQGNHGHVKRRKLPTPKACRHIQF